MEDKNLKSAAILKWVIVGLLSFAMLIFVFAFGVWVGSERAQFSFRWAENYHRNFGGPSEGFLGDFPGRGFMDGHGIFGSVLKIEDNVLIIKGQGNMEKSVITTSKTAVIRQDQDIEAGDIRVGDYVVIIGNPNGSGQIEASFIRIMPPPPVSKGFNAAEGLKY